MCGPQAGPVNHQSGGGGSVKDGKDYMSGSVTFFEGLGDLRAGKIIWGGAEGEAG